MKRAGTMLSMVVGALLLASCGQTTGDRALSGGAIGAGAGAVGGALLGSPGTGALLGGALGAGTGALTNPSQVDLGKPVWER
jgi:osmotically inducible lipoprotein OsmB